MRNIIVRENFQFYFIFSEILQGNRKMILRIILKFVEILSIGIKIVNIILGECGSEINTKIHSNPWIVNFKSVIQFLLENILMNVIRGLPCIIPEIILQIEWKKITTNLTKNTMKAIKRNNREYNKKLIGKIMQDNCIMKYLGIGYSRREQQR